MQKLKISTRIVLMTVPVLIGLSPNVYASSSTSPTLYVSSTNGSDTTGTGTIDNPYASIQHAVDLAQPGSTIQMEPGTYKQQVEISKQLTIQSDSQDENAVEKTIIDAKDYTHGIQITGDASGTKIIGLTVENANAEGILAIGPLHDLTFQNNVITNNAIGQTLQDYEALHLNGVTDSLVIHNKVVNNGDGGIYLTDEEGPNSGNQVIDNLVQDNRIDCGITLASHYPSFLPGPKHGVFNNLVENNHSIGNGAAGVFVGTYIGTVYGNQVKNNHIIGNHGGGVIMHTHFGLETVHDNVITGNHLSGNEADEITGGKKVAIAIGGEGSTITGTVISKNEIRDEDDGIYIKSDATATTTMTKNVFSNVTTSVDIGN